MKEMSSNGDSVLNVQVSAFRSVFDTGCPYNCNLLSLLISDKWSGLQRQIRQLPEEERKWAKKQLPVFTPSGIFNFRSAKGIISHSGFISFDIDQKFNPHIKDFSELRTKLGAIPFVAFCGLSVSGNGCWGLIKIAEPNYHLQYYYKIEYEFKQIGLTIDPACKNVDRSRFVFSDPGAHFNHRSATLLSFKVPNLVDTHKIKNPNLRSYTQEKVDALVEIIEERKIDLTVGYDNWLQFGFALASEFGQAGLGYFHRISRVSPQYQPLETDKQYKHCMRNFHGRRITIGTFFHACKEASIQIRAEKWKDRKSEFFTPSKANQEDRVFETLANGVILELTPEGYPAIWDTHK